MFAHAKAEQKSASKSAIQKKESKSNLTGIPNGMKTQFENQSGFSFDDVRVHYNSDKPAQLQALAYTQGSQVYVAPGQERHLGHELGHVVQQKQGRVKPTIQLMGMGVNNDEALEKEADVAGENYDETLEEEEDITGEKLVQFKSNEAGIIQLRRLNFLNIKRKNINLLRDDKYGHWWTEIHYGPVNESYGWWPDRHVGLKQTFRGVPGDLNGQIAFGGAATRDPHHGDHADEDFHPEIPDTDNRPKVQILQSIRQTINNWAGRDWRWTFGRGNNCHTFQEDIMNREHMVKPQ